MQRLNVMKLSTSNKTSLQKFDSYGIQFDKEIEEMKELQVSSRSSNDNQASGKDGSFKVILDNIDLRIVTRDMTSDRQNKDIHWVNHTAIKKTE